MFIDKHVRQIFSCLTQTENLCIEDNWTAVVREMESPWTVEICERPWTV